MTIQEFSNEFDILYNNIMSNQAPGLDEYEKSVLLTQAQEAFILEVYTGTLTGDSFEKTELVNEFLAPLIKQEILTIQEADKNHIVKYDSVLYALPEDFWLMIYESAFLSDSTLNCKNNQYALVVPVTHDEFFKINRNPFRNADYTTVLRLRNNDCNELISKYNIQEYLIRYIKRPDPIILTDLTELEVSIDNRTEEATCILPESTHKLILSKAVQLAKVSMSSK